MTLFEFHALSEDERQILLDALLAMADSAPNQIGVKDAPELPPAK